ncbi:MAG TPA: hypothetical protein VEL77_14970 [Rugosimonospora sp.]|nr:hypothetical protein [Rugosimonospora sp.]
MERAQTQTWWDAHREPVELDSPRDLREAGARLQPAAKPARRIRLSLARVMDAAESGEYLGFCLACGAEASGVEPDAHEYPCECCGEARVYGAEEILVMGLG